MRVTRKAYIAVLILSLLIANESSPFLLQPASANLLFLIPLGLRILKFLNYTTIFEAIDLLLSYLSSNHGPIKNGTVIKGISTFKRYFDLFGFLDPTFNPNSNFTDEFSNDLESAIKFFQKTFHLNATGQPDNSTVDLISRRRCGLPDVIKNNQTTSFTEWKKNHKNLTLTYAFSNDTGFPFKDTVANAFRRWSEVTRLNFTETDSVNRSDIRILQLSFGENNNNKGVVGGAWLDNTTMSWDVVLGSDEKWILLGDNTTTSERDALDLETVVMHQIGHVLGLNHSAIEEAVMYPFVDPMKKRKVDFDEDDLKKIREVYGEKLNSGEVVSPAKSPAAEDGGGVAGVGNRWGPFSSLWPGMIILLSCFWVNEM